MRSAIAYLLIIVIYFHDFVNRNNNAFSRKKIGLAS